MATIESIVRPARAGRALWRRFARGLAGWMPKGLYARSLIIIVTPIVILQAVVAFAFMERHWQQVTARLSRAVTQNIAGVIELHETLPAEIDRRVLIDTARNHFGLLVDFLPPDPLPPAGPKPFFSLLDRKLSEEVTRQIGRPFWIDTVGRSNLVEIRIRLDDEVLRVFTSRPGETVERLDLAQGANGSERAVDVQINRLRRKIGQDPASPVHLQTVRGSATAWG